MENKGLSEELRYIKNKYGQRFMTFCKEELSDVLEIEGVLQNILDSKFANNGKTLNEDIKDEAFRDSLREHIYFEKNLKYPNKEEMDDEYLDMSPFELMEKNEYELKEVRKKEDLEEYMQYYPKEDREELRREIEGYMNMQNIFFAKKYDIDDIYRQNPPRRDDKYGKSLLLIRFNKNYNELYEAIQEMSMTSPQEAPIRIDTKADIIIRGRYNKEFENYDQTLGNNLERVAPGFAGNFIEKIGEEKGVAFNLPKPVSLKKHKYINHGGKFFRYITKGENSYLLSGGKYLANGKINDIGENQILIDGKFLVDANKSTITLVDQKSTDCFVNTFRENVNEINVGNRDVKGNKEIIVKKLEENQSDLATVRIKVNKNNEIIEYENPTMHYIESSNFLKGNKTLQNIALPNITSVGDNFLADAGESLRKIDAEKLVNIGDNFLGGKAPNLQEANCYKIIDCGLIPLARSKKGKRIIRDVARKRAYHLIKKEKLPEGKDDWKRVLKKCKEENNGNVNQSQLTEEIYNYLNETLKLYKEKEI